MASDARDYKLQLSASHAEGGGVGSGPAPARPFLSLLFACCNVYARVYRAPDAPCYRGRCPRCGVGVTFQVGADGTASRFFIVQ